MTEPVAAYKGPVMWADGSNLILTVNAPEGLLYQQTFPMAVFSAVIAGDGEIIRFTYDWTDPEDGQVTRGAARLVLQQLPDPRDQKTEEQPAAPADATATDACRKCGRTFVDDGKFVDSAARYLDFLYCRTCVDRCHDTEIADHWCEIDQHRNDRKIPMTPREAPAAEVRYVERPSGPPVRVVDGPACMPAVVPNESGELVRAGSLYSDKCAECTTGVSCEDAGRCLFEG